jgi:hypothetical protein
MLSFRLQLGGDAELHVSSVRRGLWSLVTGDLLSLFTRLIRPSLADTSGLSRGTISGEPLLYAPSCASTPQGTEGSILTLHLQLFAGHNSTIHSIVGQQQQLLDGDPDSYRDWLKAASVAADLVQLLYQAFTGIDCQTLSDKQQSKS